MERDQRTRVYDAIRRGFRRGAETAFVTEAGGTPAWVFDLRSALLSGSSLPDICDLMLEALRKEGPVQFGGLETSAIALVAGLVTRAAATDPGVSGFYIRKSRRKDGFQKHIEGTLSERDIVLVDDILNSGRSLMRQIAALEAEGRRVRAACVLIRYRDASFYTEFEKRGIKVHALFSLEDFPETGGLLHEPAPPAPARPRFETVWKFASANPAYAFVIPKSAPVTDGERVYFGADNGTMWALHATDGSIAWSYRTLFGAGKKRIFSSPALAFGNVYFGAYDGNLYCLDAATGAKRWVYREADWVGSSPTIASDLKSLFVGLEFGLWHKEGALACLDPITGARKWLYEIPTLVHSSPLYVARHRLVVVGSSEGVIYGVHAKRGSLRWSFRAGAAVRASFAYDASTDTISFGSEDGSLYILNAKDGTLRHKIATYEPIYSTPTAHRGALFAGLLDKRVVRIDIARGAIEWEHWTHARVFAQPVVIGESVYIGSNDGRLYELDAATGRERSYTQFSERIVNAVAHDAASGRFFVPTYANELYCVEEVAD